MARIQGGNFKTFYISKTDKPVLVHPFLMDECAVTNLEFLEFVKANPEWSRSKVKRLFADKNYLPHQNVIVAGNHLFYDYYFLQSLRQIVNFQKPVHPFLQEYQRF